MWRIRFADGSVSGMVNLTRASKDCCMTKRRTAPKSLVAQSSLRDTLLMGEGTQLCEMKSAASF